MDARHGFGGWEEGGSTKYESEAYKRQRREIAQAEEERIAKIREEDPDYKKKVRTKRGVKFKGGKRVY